MSRAPLASLALLVSILAGGASAHPIFTVTRAIADDPKDVLTAAEAVVPARDLRWDFREGTILDGWSVGSLSTAPAAASGVILSATGSDPMVYVDGLAVDARTIDTVEVEVDRRGATGLRLFWAGAGEKFGSDRMSRADPAELKSGKVVFDLAAIPQWRGSIARLRLDPALSVGQEMVLKSISLTHEALSPLAAACATGKACKVDVGGDARSALVTRPGSTTSFAVDLARRSSLLVAVTAIPAAWSPISLSVRVLDAATPSTVLLAQQLSTPLPQPAAWNEVDVDLSKLGRRRVLVELEAAGDPAAQGKPALVAWANPRVVARRVSSKPRPNVILVSVDTLRADHLSLDGYPRSTSPNIDRWAAARGRVFRSAFAPAPWTKPSHVSLFTGLDAITHGLNWDEPMPTSLVPLAERLRVAGYSTVAVTGGVYLHPRWGFARGFERFSYWTKPDTSEELERGVDEAVRFLASSAGSPFFLFFHTYEVHGPFRKRQPYFDRFSDGSDSLPEQVYRTTVLPPSEEDGFRARFRLASQDSPGEKSSRVVEWADSQRVVDAYDSGVAYMDAQIGRLLKALDRAGLASSTVVVLVSDHGEALGDKQLANHVCLYDFLLRVPLVVAGPKGLVKPGIVEEQVGLIDVAPTILDLVGVAAPEGMDGISLHPLLTGEGRMPSRALWSYAPSSNYGVSVRSDSGQKLILNHAAWDAVRGQTELYDLASDPNEEHDLSSSREAATAEMRAQAVDRLETAWTGARLGLVNPTPQAVTFELEGGAVRLTHLHSWRGTGAVHRIGNSRHVSVALPPGNSLDLVVDGAGDEGLKVRVAGTPAAWVIRPGEGDTVLEVPRSGNGAEPTARITVQWRRPSVAIEGSGEAIPQSVREQLEALGYGQ